MQRIEKYGAYQGEFRGIEMCRGTGVGERSVTERKNKHRRRVAGREENKREGDIDCVSSEPSVAEWSKGVAREGGIPTRIETRKKLLKICIWCYFSRMEISLKFDFNKKSRGKIDFPMRFH